MDGTNNFFDYINENRELQSHVHIVKNKLKRCAKDINWN
jgi:hypothetical protein